MTEAPRPKRVGLFLVLALYLLVTLAYGAVNPLFEAPDEHWHYFTAQYIADERLLPAVAPGDDYDEWLSQEAAQPPLYYILGAALIAPLDTDGARDSVWLNKFASIGDASALTNINRVVHTSAERWPWQGYVLAAHVLRIFSTLLGLGTLLCIYASGRQIWPALPGRALLATALVAFLPQFNFLHASVTNDTLVIFLASAALWQLIRLWQTHVSAGRLLLLGITIGLAALSKNAGMVLLVYAAGVLVALVLRGNAGSFRGLPALGRIALLVVVPAVALAGWLWWRNWALYGDITATNQFIRIAGGDRGYTLPQVLGETDGLWLSLFAVFGWFNLRPPEWVYWFWNGVVVLGTAGAAWGVSRTDWRQQVRPDAADGLALLLGQRWVLPLLLFGWVLAVYAGLVTFMLRTEAAQGRLLFPAILPLALGLAYGLTTTTWLRRVGTLLAAAALPVTLFCLWFVVRPAYMPPTTVTRLPEDATTLNVNVGQGLRLVGARVESGAVEPGDPVWLTLYWQAGFVPEEPPEQVISIFGQGITEVGKLHSYHGRGLYPATLWPPGRIVADRFGMWLDEETAVPVLARIDVGVAEGDQRALAGEVKVRPPAWPEPELPTLARIGDAIEITAVSVSPTQAKPGDLVQVQVQWYPTSQIMGDLTTLVHLGQPDQPPLAVGDRPPLNGDYPTRAWARGEVIHDTYELQLPVDLRSGRYPVWLGMYDSETIVRQPVTINGERQPYDVYLAGWVEISD